MSDRPYFREVTISETFSPVEASRTVIECSILAPSTNSSAVIFEAADGSEVPWPAGWTHTFSRIDLSQIRIKGTAGDKLLIVGHD